MEKVLNFFGGFIAVLLSLVLVAIGVYMLTAATTVNTAFMGVPFMLMGGAISFAFLFINDIKRD